MDESISNFKGAWCIYFYCISYRNTYLYAKSENPDHTSCSYASDLGLNCLPMSIFTGHYAQVAHEAMSEKFFNFITVMSHYIPKKKRSRKDKIQPYVFVLFCFVFCCCFFFFFLFCFFFVLFSFVCFCIYI